MFGIGRKRVKLISDKEVGGVAKATNRALTDSILLRCSTGALPYLSGEGRGALPIRRMTLQHRPREACILKRLEVHSKMQAEVLQVTVGRFFHVAQPVAPVKLGGDVPVGGQQQTQTSAL